jgi:hypothetical protein
LINQFNPEKIVLDGGVVRATGELLLEPLKEKAMASSLPAMKDPVTHDLNIVPSRFLYEAKSAIAYGAVATVIEAIDSAFTGSKKLDI